MSWSQCPHFPDERPITEIPGSDITPRISDILDSNPVINGSISILVTDGNPRIESADAQKIRKTIKKLLPKVLKHCAKGRRTWREFEQLIAKEITDSLIFFNHRSYLTNANIQNSIQVHKGDLFFLPSYFVFREVRYAGSRALQFFGHRNVDYPTREFYCEALRNERHPNLTIQVSPCGDYFDVLVCTTSPFVERNEPITLIRQGSSFDQFVALDWRIKASRKMLDILNTLSYDFLIDDTELARIEARELLFI